jgi:hypothetical protein
MTAFRSSDESFDRLHRPGWSVGETGTVGAWVVSSQNGEDEIFAVGATHAEA